MKFECMRLGNCSEFRTVFDLFGVSNCYMMLVTCSQCHIIAGFLYITRWNVNCVDCELRVLMTYTCFWAQNPQNHESHNLEFEFREGPQNLNITEKCKSPILQCSWLLKVNFPPIRSNSCGFLSIYGCFQLMRLLIVV